MLRRRRQSWKCHLPRWTARKLRKRRQKQRVPEHRTSRQLAVVHLSAMGPRGMHLLPGLHRPTRPIVGVGEKVEKVAGSYPDVQATLRSRRQSPSTTRTQARSASRGRRSTSRRGRGTRLSASIPEVDEEDEDVQLDPEEAETLRRADERYHLWRMFENRRHPTPPLKGHGKERANTGQRNPEVPRPRPTTATAEADPKFHECLARGGTRYEAFKQHKSRLRTRAFQDFYGLEPTPPEAREARPPPMMSQGGFHRRLVMPRLRSQTAVSSQRTTSWRVLLLWNIWPTSSPTGRGLLPAKGKNSPKPSPKTGTHRQLPAAVAPGTKHLGCNRPKAEDFLKKRWLRVG